MGYWEEVYWLLYMFSAQKSDLDTTLIPHVRITSKYKGECHRQTYKIYDLEKMYGARGNRYTVLAETMTLG